MRSVSVYVLAISALLLTRPSRAQAPDRTPAKVSHVVYMEFVGTTQSLSINYERPIASSPYRLRLGLDPYEGLSRTRVAILGDRYFRWWKHGIELSLGIVASPDRFLGSHIIGTGVLGYRFEPAGGGFVFRVSLTPFIARDGVVLNTSGISVGYAF